MRIVIAMTLVLLLSGLVGACLSDQDGRAGTSQGEDSPLSATSDSMALALIQQSVARSGGERYRDSRIAFVMRNRHYLAQRSAGQFTYERRFRLPNGDSIRDVLNNQGFYREVDGQKVTLSLIDSSNYAQSVNSVLYFALQPFPLQDPAVHARYQGETTFEGQPYHKVIVTFSETNGGADFEDEYCYWIHRDSFTVDYMAYNYQTNEGGARFRKAYNPRMLNGIRFADYVNFKPTFDTREISLFDSLFLTGWMDTVSLVNLEKITVE